MRHSRVLKYVTFTLFMAAIAYSLYLGNYFISHRSTVPSAAYPKAFAAHGDDVYISAKEWQTYWGNWVLIIVLGIIAGSVSLIDKASEKKGAKTDEGDD